MKQKNTKKIRKVNQVAIQFTSKPISAWGGIASLVAPFLEQINFRGWVEKNIPIQESSNNSKGVYEKIIAQFLTILCGGSRFNHLSWWGHGIEAMTKSFGLKWLPKSASTITRFWGKVNKQSISEKLSESCRAHAGEIIDRDGIFEDYLNLDSTVLTRFGEQEGAKIGYNPAKRGRASHHPIIAFIGSGYVVNLWNRSGNTFSGQNAAEFFEQSRLALNEDFYIKGVLCDTGFYDIGFIKYLEEKCFRYIMAVPMSQTFQRQIHRIKKWRKVDEGIEVGDFYFEHLDKKWTKKRRYVVIKQEITRRRKKVRGKQLKLFKDDEEWKERRFSLLITNDSLTSPVEIWREYRPRANDENVIKDLKEGYGLDSFSLKNFWATEAVMVITALVFHNLIHYLNRKVLNAHTSKEQLKTIRSKYLILPAQLGKAGRYPILRLGVQNRKFRSKIIYLFEKIRQINWTFNCNAVEGGVQV